MRIFLISGKAGSGKNEVARLIKEFYIYKHEESAITSYSKNIKIFTKELTDWDGNEENKPRKFMQTLGDNIRSINSEYFTSNMIEDIAVYEKYVKNLIISDCRMPNEIDNIKESFDEVYSFYIVNQFSESKLDVEEQAHITETALEDYTDFDYIIANDELDKLKDKIFKILEGID